MASHRLPLILLLVSSLLLSFSECRDLPAISSGDSIVPRSENEMQSMFESWIVQQKRSYSSSVEKDKRFGIFKDNLKYVDAHNALANQTFKLGLNRFADLTNNEFRANFLGLNSKPPGSKGSVKSNIDVPDASALPASVDWRTKGVVNPIKDQGQCGKIFLLLKTLNSKVRFG
ncbi:cysteine proteinase [Genlisea aurea]|uniref:Cysteine proteinase n=1 Tax=Genlisea aurea TaxID=192259 RepID=S8C2R8_9LAMI|nr:cysteine proteinase [Genlisea aurea]